MHRWLILLLLLTTTACSACASPGKVRIFGAQPLEPEAWYERLYVQAKNCVTAGGGSVRPDSEYRKIRWFVVPKAAMGEAVGLWSWPDRIFLDEAYVANFYVIRHEELHMLLGGGFVKDPHEVPDFVRCVNAPLLDSI